MTDDAKELRNAMLLGYFRLATFIGSVIWGLWYLYHIYTVDGLTLKLLIPLFVVVLVFQFNLWWAGSG